MTLSKITLESGKEIHINPDAVSYMTEGRPVPAEPTHPDTPVDEKPPTVLIYLIGRTEPLEVIGILGPSGQVVPFDAEKHKHDMAAKRVKDAEFAAKRPGDTNTRRDGMTSTADTKNK